VKRAFYGVQADEQLVQRLELINDIDKTAAELAQKQHEAGNVNDLDLENQRTIYTASQAHVAQARIDILHDREALNRLLGWTEALPRWTVAGQLPAIQADPLPASALERRALVQRLDIAAARKRIEAFRKSLGVTEASRFFPGGVNIGVDTEENPDRSRVTGPSIDVEVPIFDQGQAKVATAQAQLRQAQNRLKTLVVNARSDIRESRAVLEACRSLAETYRKTLLPERVRILQLSQELYNYMLQGSYDLLLAKQQEIEAERDTWRNYWVTRADLEKAVGGFLPVATADAKH
jgi:cobalt-zinc-cadmium efflux system outer membrane protein